MTTKGTHSISLRSIALALVYIGVFFIPFNSWEKLEFLREYGRHSCTLFFLAAVVVVGVDIALSRKMLFPYRNFVFQLLLLLIVWFAVATLLNIHNIRDYYFKETPGVVRFITQYGSLFLSAVVFLLVFLNAFNGRDPIQLFRKIRRAILYSLMVASTYSFFEILIVKFQKTFLIPVIELFNYVPFVQVKLDDRLHRISSISIEPPELGTYLISIAGWMFSYMLTGKGVQKYVPAVLVLILALFSDSRSGMGIVLVQAVIFGVLLLMQRDFRPVLYRAVALAMIPLAVVLIFKGKDITYYMVDKAFSFSTKHETHGGSNKSRLGIQYANLVAFTKRPLSGAGFGQSAYAARAHYPRWAMDGNWEFSQKYLNPNHRPFPPVYNMYVRLLSESGLIGLIIFVLFVFTLLWVCYTLYKKPGGDTNRRIIAIALFVTVVGISLNWLKSDTFRIFGFWVTLAFFLYITGNRLKIVK